MVNSIINMLAEVFGGNMLMCTAWLEIHHTIREIGGQIREGMDRYKTSIRKKCRI